MFWNANHTSCHVDTLLANENVTLTELMDEEAILQECKSQNKKLTEFLIRPTILSELVTLITEEPPDDVDIMNRYRYSSIACEILTSDIPLVCERISVDAMLMDKLCSFIDRPPPLNPLLASFFSKAIEKLLAKRPKQDFYTHQMICLGVLEYFKNRKSFLPSLLINIGTSAIMDTLKHMISVDADVRKNMIEWLESQGCVEQLVQILCGTHKTISHCPIKPIPYVEEKKPVDFVDSTKALEVEAELSSLNDTQQSVEGEQNGSVNLTLQDHAGGHLNDSIETEKEIMAKLRRRLLTYQSANASELLYNIIQSGELLHRDYVSLGIQTDLNVVYNNWDDIRNQESENVINLLLESIFTTPMETRQIALINGIRVLIALLNHMTTPACAEITEKLQQTDLSDASVSGFVQAAGDNTRSTSIDESSERDCAVRQRAAKAVAPHLPLLHQALLVAPIHNMSPCSHIPEPVGEARLSITKLIPELIKLESIEVAEVIVTLGTLGIMLDMFFKHQWNNFLHANVERTITLAVYSKVAGPLYLKHLIFECNLLDRLLTAWENNEKKVGIQIIRQGYMGHVILMLGELFKLFENDLQLLDNIGVPEEIKIRWQNFVEDKLKAVIELHAGCLGGYHPAHQNFENHTDYNEFETSFPTDAGNLGNSNFEDLGDEWGQEPFIESLETCNLILDSHSPWASEEEAAAQSDHSGWADFNYFDSNAEFPEDLHAETENINHKEDIRDLLHIDEVENTITIEEEPHSKNIIEVETPISVQEEKQLKNSNETEANTVNQLEQLSKDVNDIKAVNTVQGEQPLKNICEVGSTFTAQEEQAFENVHEVGTTAAIQEIKLLENIDRVGAAVIVQEERPSKIIQDTAATNPDQEEQKLTNTTAFGTSVLIKEDLSWTHSSSTEDTNANSMPTEMSSENADVQNFQTLESDLSDVPTLETVIDNSSLDSTE